MSFPKPREADIQRAILNYLRLRGAVAIRINSGAVRAVNPRNGKQRFVRFNDSPGISDILACLPNGRFLAVEVKKPGSRTDPLRQAAQHSFLDAISAAGGLVLVATSVSDVERALRLESLA